MASAFTIIRNGLLVNPRRRPSVSADILVDGGFVGNTPSDVQVTEGEHTITVKKTGFKDWERMLKVTGGSSVHLNAELDKATNP